MAGGMNSRGRENLAARTARTRAPETSWTSRSRPDRNLSTPEPPSHGLRHVWITDRYGRNPGLLHRWERVASGWRGYVTRPVSQLSGSGQLAGVTHQATIDRIDGIDRTRAGGGLSTYARRTVAVRAAPRGDGHRVTPPQKRPKGSRTHVTPETATHSISGVTSLQSPTRGPRADDGGGLRGVGLNCRISDSWRIEVGNCFVWNSC